MFTWSRPHICSKMTQVDYSVGLVKAKRGKKSKKKQMKSKTPTKLKSKETILRPISDPIISQV